VIFFSYIVDLSHQTGQLSISDGFESQIQHFLNMCLQMPRLGSQKGRFSIS
jgi:hypothetical protein